MRIVSLVPSITELLADLGLDDQVVGLTRFCELPEGWMCRKSIVGGTKTVDVERVRALQPDLVIANREENVREEVEALSAFTDVHVTDVSTVVEGLDMIREVGRLVEKSDAATALAAEIEVGFARLETRERLPAAYLIWRDPYMSVGGDTFISNVMARGGFANVFSHEQRYPEVTPAALTEAGAEVILLSSEPYPFRESHVAELRGAVSGAPVQLVDGRLFSWYGSRMLHMPAYLHTLRDRISG